MYSSLHIDVKRVEKMMHKEVIETERVTCEKQERMALITLNYPEKRNALGLKMRMKMMQHIHEWVENPDVYAIVIESNHPEFFSAGADILEVLDVKERSNEQALDLFIEEYETIWAIDCLPRPFISLMNGKVMGGGIGISHHGTHTVAGENYSWSMPEVKIGLFPDVGITRKLANMPGAIGIYLGLTGREINRDDARYLDLIEFCIDAAEFETIKQKLREAIPIDPVLDELNQPAGKSELEEKEAFITSIFSKSTVEEIIAALDKVEGENKAWADETLALLNAASPTSLKLTLEAIKRMKGRPLEVALAQDLTLASHCLVNHDFPHAIKARMVEKKTPEWQPDNLAAVSEAAVNAYFTPNTDKRLNLPPRELGVDK